MRYAITITLAGAALYLAWTFSARRTGPYDPKRRTGADTPAQVGPPDDGRLRILQFYATPAVLIERQKALLCYGVANAVSVRIEPPVEKIEPSPNRCVVVRPALDTRYTLVAEGADGKTQSQSTSLVVRPDPETEPAIPKFYVQRSQVDYSGKRIFSLCYETEHASGVRLEPREVELGGAVRGCFWVAPRRTTRYRLTAVGTRSRQAVRELTVAVP